MIFIFFNYLQKENISYCITNGYIDIISQKDTDSDIDMLFKKQDFNNIENILKAFCKENNLQIVQFLHHDLYAKNIFLYNSKDKQFLNLDIYGELSRRGIVFFNENNIFKSIDSYENIPILSTEKEFIQYLVKKLDKNDFSKDTFVYLRNLYLKSQDKCDIELKKKFLNKFNILIDSFVNDDYEKIVINKDILIKDFDSLKKINLTKKVLNLGRTVKRIIKPTGLTISFLGSDGAGKSTIIDEILEKRLPFRRKDYFHLKPLKSKNEKNTTVEDPHKYPPYSKLKSYIKLLYFIYQYNFGWLKNIVPLKIKSSLVIFDRYFDDMLVDTKRYRYGGSVGVAKFARLFIPKPDIYFILTTDPKVIYERKQEVAFEELERQVKEYRALADGKRYFNIDVSRTPEDITKEIIQIMMENMNERY